MVTIAAALAQATDILSPFSVTPRLDAEVLLISVLNINKAFLLSHAEQVLSNETLSKLEHLVARRCKGEPTAYLTGHREFWSLTLQVNPSVLIPRPETELLVELALSSLPKDENLSIADLGTGSGAIALALAQECPHWQLYATDQSLAALSVAQANAQRLQLSNIKFFAGNWCAALPAQRFAAIISNPPYIEASDPHLSALNFEPQNALVAGEDGLVDLAQIIQQAPDYLENNGLLLLEHGYNQGLIVADKFTNAGYDSVKTVKDLAGHDRVTLGRIIG